MYASRIWSLIINGPIVRWAFLFVGYPVLISEILFFSIKNPLIGWGLGILDLLRVLFLSKLQKNVEFITLRINLKYNEPKESSTYTILKAFTGGIILLDGHRCFPPCFTIFLLVPQFSDSWTQKWKKSVLKGFKRSAPLQLRLKEKLTQIPISTEVDRVSDFQILPILSKTSMHICPIAVFPFLFHFGWLHNHIPAHYFWIRIFTALVRIWNSNANMEKDLDSWV